MTSLPQRSAKPKITSLKEGRYQLGKRIGKGGMASVYLAKDIATGDRVAVKLPHRKLAAEPGLNPWTAIALLVAGSR